MSAAVRALGFALTLRDGITGSPSVAAHADVTQVPIPSHWPAVAQWLPAAFGVLVGTPLMQTSSVQGLLSSTGTQAAPPVPLLLLAAELLDEAEEVASPPAPPALVDEEVVVEELPPVPPELELTDEEQPRAARLAVSTRSKAEAPAKEARRSRAEAPFTSPRWCQGKRT